MGELLFPFGGQTRKILTQVFKLNGVTLIIGAVFESFDKVLNRGGGGRCEVGRDFSSIYWRYLERILIMIRLKRILRCWLSWFNVTSGWNLSRDSVAYSCLSW